MTIEDIRRSAANLDRPSPAVGLWDQHSCEGLLTPQRLSTQLLREWLGSESDVQTRRNPYTALWLGFSGPNMENDMRRAIQRMDDESVWILGELTQLSLWSSPETYYELSPVLRALFLPQVSAAVRVSALHGIRLKMRLRSEVHATALLPLTQKKASVQVYDILFNGLHHTGHKINVVIEKVDLLSGLASLRFLSSDGVERSITVPVGVLLGHMTTESFRQNQIPLFSIWSWASASYYRYHLAWQQVRDETTPDGRRVIMKADAPPDRPDIDDLRIRQREAEHDLRNRIVEIPLLRKVGFAYDRHTGETALPDVDLLNSNSFRLQGRWGDLASQYTFVRVNNAGEMHVLPYVREVLEDRMPLGVEAMGTHDVATHIEDHLAVPGRFGEQIKAYLKFLVDLRDDSVLKSNAGFVELIDGMLTQWAFDKDNMSAGDFFRGLRTRNFGPFSDSRWDLVSSRFVEYLVTYASGSVHDSAMVLKSVFENQNHQADFVDRKGKPGISVQLAPNQYAALVRICANQSRHKISKEEIIRVLSSTEYFNFVMAER